MLVKFLALWDPKLKFKALKLNLWNLRRCWPQSNNINKLIFVIKNWLNDFRMDCILLSNLIEFIEVHFLKRKSNQI